MISESGVALGAALMYLMAIMPSRKKRGRLLKGKFFAHRGLHNKTAGIPENTMAAFRRAVEEGYGIELDVQLTKDEEVVVFHDFDLKRVCSVEGEVSEFTYEELQSLTVCGTGERIPRLRDVLNMVNGRVPLLVELKYKGLSSRICERADEMLQRYRGEYVIESFHPRALWWYRRHRPEICRGQLSMNFQKREGSYHPAEIMARHLLFNFLGKPDFIAYDIRDKEALSKNICRRWFGCPSAAWTVRSNKQLETARAYYDSFIFEGFLPGRNVTNAL